jgi:hypothetical protein
MSYLLYPAHYLYEVSLLYRRLELDVVHRNRGYRAVGPPHSGIPPHLIHPSYQGSAKEVSQVVGVIREYELECACFQPFLRSC